MKRLKPYIVDWPVSLSEVADALGKMTYSEKRGYGFTVSSVRRQKIEATFAERLIRKRSIVDPFGKTRVEKQTSFHFTEMVITSGTVGLELSNPGRSQKLLFASLVSTLEDFFVISEPNVKIEDWGKAIRKSLSNGYIFSQIRLTEVPISKHAIANVHIKGTVDLQKSAKAYFKDGGEIDRICIEKIGDPSTRILIASDGSLSVSEVLSNTVISKVQKCRDQFVITSK